MAPRGGKGDPDARAPEETSRSLADGSSYAFVLVGADYRLRHVSPQAVQITGYSIDELIGLDPFTLVDSDDRERMRQLFAALLPRPGATVSAECRMIRKDGSVWRAALRGTNLVDDPGVRAMAVTYRDITDKKMSGEARRPAEDVLRASEERSRLILASARQAYVAIDANGIITDWNTAAQFTFGWSPGEAIGRQLAALIIPPRYRQAHIEGLTRFRETGESRIVGKRQEFSAIHRDGHEFPVEFSISVLREGSTYSFHAFVADITARSRMEAALRESEARIRSIVESTSDGIIFVSLDGRVASVNRRAHEMLSVEPAGIEGASFASALAKIGFSRQDQNALSAAAHGVLGGLGEDYEGDAELAARRLVMHWVARAARDNAGSLTGMTFTLRDVTQDREISRMKSEFVSFVTHQLRTPLAGIKWLLELAADANEAEVLQSYISDAREINERMVRLVNDLLDLSRLESGGLQVEVQPVDLRALTQDIVTELEPGLRQKQHRISITGDDDIPLVLSDSRLLRQVFSNLLSNAVKYTPPGGSIRVQIRRDEERVSWSVEDTGIGIPARNIPLLFQKFYRAENALAINAEGTGLGLAVARLIIERLGGRVWCESEEGHGATFFCALPIERRADTNAVAQARVDR
jgi:PAS domain S-box-containing protein